MARNTIQLSDIINNMLLTRDEDDYGKCMNDRQLYTYGKECIRAHLTEDLGAYPKSVKLTVNSTLNVVALPSDYIDYTKIGVLDSECRVQVLGINEKINYAGSYTLDGDGDPLVDSNGVEILAAKDCEPSFSGGDNFGSYYFFNNYHIGNTNGRLFGVGGGNNARGYYRINKMDNRIELDSQFNNSTIILEYLADESIAANPVIPVQAEEMVRNYIYFRSISTKSSVPQSAVQIAENRFYQTKRRANFKMKSFTKSEIAQTINKSFQAAPKFLFD